jgi:hypothetical protein
VTPPSQTRLKAKQQRKNESYGTQDDYGVQSFTGQTLLSYEPEKLQDDDDKVGQKNEGCCQRPSAQRANMNGKSGESRISRGGQAGIYPG